MGSRGQAAAAAVVYPRVVGLKEPAQRERDRLLCEAAIQSEQLVVSSETWDEQAQDVLTSKLKIPKTSSSR